MRISKSVTAEIGHRLLNYNGKCNRLHGHSYKFTVTVEGEIDQYSGMVMDFRDLKDRINSIVRFWDHRMILQTGDPIISHINRSEIVVFDKPPTAENMAKHLFVSLRSQGLSVVSVIVRETSTSTAEVTNG